MKIRFCLNGIYRYQSTSSVLTRNRLTNDEIRVHRLRIFNNERQIQMERIRRVEKIEIDVQDPIQSTKLLMNKNFSTPYHCAQHLSSILVDRSCLALIDDQYIWDMNRPLERDCKLKFLHFLEEKCEEQNRAYWRTCSFIIGYILETAFKSNYQVELCSFPPPQFQYGSIAYDVQLNIENWQPNRDDLRCLSIQAYKLRDRDLRFERLDITQSVAEEMFAYDRFKLAQIPHMLRLLSPDDNQTRLTVYRMGDCHVDITRGPLISSTKQIGRFEFSAIHTIDVPSYNETMQRVQALSIPNQLHLHYWTFDYLLERAKKLNGSSIPSLAKIKTTDKIE
jgi:large subunit ribosomal protein L39